MRRINKEIEYFNYLNCSICWLSSCGKQKLSIKDFKLSLKDGNPKVLYHIGCYKSSHDEFQINLINFL